MERAPTSEAADAQTRRVWLLILVLVAARLACASLAPLAFDEAYYWRLSQHLAAGYYDHPPLVMVGIRVGTMLLGDTAVGIRLVSVLLGVAATWAMWRSAEILLGDRRLAATAALYFNVTLIVAVGTVLATPDAPLLAACAFVLFFLAKLDETENGAWWLAVGAAAGMALLAKYNALMLGVSILAWLLLVPPKRRWLATPWPWLGGLVALGLFTPVIVWNAEHQWMSFARQFGRAVPFEFSPLFVLEYAGSQIGAASPFVFVAGAMGLIAFSRARAGRSASAHVMLAAFVWPVALYFAWHSLHARVEGNWTVPAFPAFAIISAAAVHTLPWEGIRSGIIDSCRRLAVPAGLALTALIYLQTLTGMVPLGAIDPTARQLGVGWPKLGTEIDALRRQAGARAVATHGYAATAWLSYYLPTHPPVVQLNERYRWTNEREPDPTLLGAPLLYVCATPCEHEEALRQRFETVEKLGELARSRSGVEIQRFGIFRVGGARGDPLEHDPPPRFGGT